MPIELGLYTFGDVVGAGTPNADSAAQTMREAVVEAQLADRLGLDFFGFGEHHRTDMVIAVPDTFVAFAAGCTEQIRLGTSVTILTTDDPIRVYQRFATMAALAPGRIETTIGRGAFSESFPLFGYDQNDTEKLFAEKFGLLLELVKGGPIDWSGENRPPVKLAHGPVPVMDEEPFAISVGVGGDAASVERAARNGLPVILAMVGGSYEKFAPLAKVYRETLAANGFGHVPIGVSSFGHIAASDDDAMEQVSPHILKVMNHIRASRSATAMTRDDLVAQAGLGGSIFVGSPETVANKIIALARKYRFDRLDLKYAHGDLSHDLRMESIRLYATEVAPRVREALSS